jgi:hypothetical protein
MGIISKNIAASRRISRILFKCSLLFLHILQPKLDCTWAQREYGLAPLGPHDLQLASIPTISGVTDWHAFSYIAICHSIQHHGLRFLHSENPISYRNSGLLCTGLRGVLFLSADALGFAITVSIPIP